MDDKTLVVSDSGYLKLLYTELQNIELVHLVSGLDEDVPDYLHDGATPTAITGYTEWVSEDRSLISIGWDWQMLGGKSNIQLARVGGASSNIMLQSPTRIDLGAAKTALLLETLIDTLDWQPAALEYVAGRYRHAPPPVQHMERAHHF